MTRNAPALIGMSVLAAAAFYLAATYVALDPRAADAAGTARLATAISLILVIGGAALLGHQQGVSAAMRQTLAWSALALGGLVVFAYRAEFHDIGGPLLARIVPMDIDAADIRPIGSAGSNGPAEAVITAGRGGHFFVETMVNGTHVQMIADTGATLVALTAEDAHRIGFDPDALDYRYRHRTASGYANAAHVTLDELSVGPVTLSDVPASISEPGVLAESLLGMSFLSGLESFHIRGDQLVLRQ